MARFHFIVKIVKVFRFAFSVLGLLQLSFNKSQKLYQHKANCCRFVTAIFIVLILFLYNLLSNAVEKENKLVNDLNIESRPANSELRSERFFSIFIFLSLVWSWAKKNQLWNLVNEAQLTYKQIKSLLGKHLNLECSWLVLVYSIFLLLLLGVFGAKSLYYDLPKLVDEQNIITLDGLLQLLNLIMGLPRLIIVLTISLHILYHLMNASWLQSLIELRLHRNLQLYQFQLNILIPSHKKLNILAGYYFRMCYICFLYMLAFRFNHFLQYCVFDSNQVTHKTQYDLEDEAIWAGQDIDNLTNPRDQLIKSLLILSWHLALVMLLLASAYMQQNEYLRLMQESWNFKTDENNSEVKAFLAEKSWKGHTFKRMDILDIMFLSGVSICDHQPVSICFLTDRFRKKNPTYLNLDFIAGHFRLFFNVVISSGIVYFAQQMELRKLQEYLQQEG
ncbi:uncharacterized protein Grl62a [Drosophila kikkawai]|uniref:Uncharacterized protein Grl62a n=1 Tax=Drosophila kikkawai TaxID=30033 RepID=A0A6P4IJG3_DROKI|nr:uncharacterized protein LOC108074976 [Drosophila kikkawai]